MIFPFTKSEVENLTIKDIHHLAFLDSQGFLIAPNENFDEFKKRIIKIYDITSEFNDAMETDKPSDLIPFLSLKQETKVPIELLQEASVLTNDTYSFSINWVPSFFASKSLGLFGGACAICFTELSFSIFLIRKAFENSKKWIIYRREELLSHELCHIARSPIQDMTYEEHFAYNLSFSPFRRYIGNCFQSQYDTLLFFVPIFIMLLAQFAQIFFFRNLWIWPFTIFAVLYPSFLLIKNHFTRRTFFKAVKILNTVHKEKTYSILFRLTGSEIAEVAKLKEDDIFDWFEMKAEKDLRIKLIMYRFLS